MKWVKSAIFFVLLSGVLGLWAYYQFNANNNDVGLGEAGDSFGSLNALFTGLAFVGLIWTISQQSEQLKAQREELKLTRQEMKNSTAQLEAQKNAMEIQNFQAMFTSLLNTYSNNLNAIHYEGYSGIRALATIGKTLDKSSIETTVRASYLELKNVKNGFNIVQWGEWENLQRITPLINSYIQIYSFINKSVMAEQEKVTYFELLYNLPSDLEYVLIVRHLEYLCSDEHSNPDQVAQKLYTILLVERKVLPKIKVEIEIDE